MRLIYGNYERYPHPGEFIKETFLEPYGISGYFLAKYLKVAPSTINRIIKGESSVSVDMAFKLQEVLGVSAETWLTMQMHYELLPHRDSENLDKIDFDSIEMV